MMDRGHGKMWLCCDVEGCKETTTEHGRLEFSEVIDEAKNDGWLFERISGEWVHTCPKCK